MGAAEGGQATGTELGGVDPARVANGHVEAPRHHARDHDGVVADTVAPDAPLDAEVAGGVGQGRAEVGRAGRQVPPQRPVVLDPRRQLGGALARSSVTCCASWSGRSTPAESGAGGASANVFLLADHVSDPRSAGGREVPPRRRRDDEHPHGTRQDRHGDAGLRRPGGEPPPSGPALLGGGRWRTRRRSTRCSPAPPTPSASAGWRATKPPGWPNENGTKQFHFDLAVDDLDNAQEAAVELGATVADPQPGETWRVLFDPFGPPLLPDQGRELGLIERGPITGSPRLKGR